LSQTNRGYVRGAALGRLTLTSHVVISDPSKLNIFIHVSFAFATRIHITGSDITVVIGHYSEITVPYCAEKEPK